MHYFDLHGDIGYDVLKYHKLGETNVFETHHLSKFEKGHIQIMCMASYFEGHETWEEMQEMVLCLKEDLKTCPNVEIVRNVPEYLDENKIYALLSIEGMCGIHDDVEAKIQWLHDQGIVLASLAWNDENDLATGVNGNPEHGLTTMGKQAITKMEELGMVLDVSHLNEKSFWDVVSYSTKPFIASHSNTKALCKHPRNLSDAQLLAIAKKGGIVGINSAYLFIDENRNNQDCLHLAKHMKHIADLVGIEHVALGLDCMDYFEGHEMPIDFRSCEDTNRLYEAMKHYFCEDEIHAICMNNAKSLFKNES